MQHQLESLESRRLLHADFSAAVNFQPADVAKAPGMLIDYGSTFDYRRGGYQYGWSTDLSANLVDRNVTRVQRNDTFIVMPTGAKWEMTVPNGQYKVYAVAGEPLSQNERMAVNIEGQTIVSGVTKYARRYLEGSGTVNVTDGKITVQGEAWVTQNKLAYLAIESVEADTPATLSIETNFATAREADGFAGSMTLTRGGHLDTKITVPLAVSGTATNSTDYGRIGGAVTFLPGVKSVTLRVVPVKDGVNESNETVIVTLGNVSGYTITQASATVTIQNETVSVPSNESWISGASAPRTLAEVGGAIVGNIMYMHGGQSQAMYRYNLSTNTWMSNGANRLYWGDHIPTEAWNNKIYLIGGLGAAAGKLQIYDIATNKWSLGASMPDPTIGSSATAVVNGKIYSFGGNNGSSVSNYHGTGTTNKSYVYDIATNKWSTLANMPIGRNHAASATDGSKVYVIGGRDGKNATTNGFNDVMIYDIASNTWVWDKTSGGTIPALPQARGGMGKGVYANGEVYVIGGETKTGAGATAQKVYKRVDVYNPVTRTWRRAPDMPTGRHGIFPLLHNNRIYVAMGCPVAEGGETAILEILKLS